LIELVHADRAIPDDGTRLENRFASARLRARADIEDHVVVADFRPQV
jgi:hypothetical protein